MRAHIKRMLGGQLSLLHPQLTQAPELARAGAAGQPAAVGMVLCEVGFDGGQDPVQIISEAF